MVESYNQTIFCRTIQELIVIIFRLTFIQGRAPQLRRQDGPRQAGYFLQDCRQTGHSQVGALEKIQSI